MADTCFLIAWLFTATVLPEPELLDRAEASFASGVQAHSSTARQAFAQAAADYEALRLHGIENADLYRNQGNAYLLAGEVPHAILAYRRGLRLAPNDRGLQSGLDYAREQVAHTAPGLFGRPPVDHWPPFLPRPLPSLALALAVVSYGLCCVLLTRWLMTRRSGLLAAGAAAGLLAALLAVPVLLADFSNRLDRAQPLVVVAGDNLPLRKGNGRAYPAHPWPLPRGAEGRLLFARGNWLQIELSGGEIGWVPRAAVVLGE